MRKNSLAVLGALIGVSGLMSTKSYTPFSGAFDPSTPSRIAKINNRRSKMVKQTPEQIAERNAHNEQIEAKRLAKKAAKLNKA